VQEIADQAGHGTGSGAAGRRKRGGAVVWDRIASVEYAGRAGAGCVVAPGVILTARHLVEYEAGFENEPHLVQISNREVDGGRVRAELAWQRGEMALLRCRPRDLGQEFPPVRWGELACTKPPAPRPECCAVGLPHEAMLRLFGEGAGREAPFGQPQGAAGRISSVDNASRLYSLQIDHQPPEHLRGEGFPWRGMSGAAVCCGELLIGMVAHPPSGWSHGRLEAVPARQLLEDRGFCDIIAAASGGVRPRLEAADLAGLFDGRPQPVAAASYLLSPRSEVVDFLGLDAEIGALSGWCHTPQAVDVAVLEGVAGSGKTRLGAELVRRVGERRAEAECDPSGPDVPWTAGFLSQVPAWHPTPWEMLRHLTRPALIVIDDAEGRLEQVEEMLTALTGHQAPPGRRIRLLLTARSTRGWWEQLKARHPGATTGTSVVLNPRAVYRHYTPAQVQELAELAFSKRILALHRAGVQDDWDAYEAADRRAALPTPHTQHSTERGAEHNSGASGGENVPGVLALHMDALAGVLLQSPGEPTGDHPATVTLLDHELQYARRAAGSEGPADVSPELLRTLVTVQGMAGAQDKEEADAVVRTAWEFHHRSAPCPLDADMLLRLRRAAAEVYPPVDGSYFTPVGPAALTAALIERAEEDSGGDFLASVLPSPAFSPQQRRHCLTALARSVSAQPRLLEGATSAIAAHGEVLARPATGIARQLPEPWQVAWLKAIEKATPNPGPQANTPAGTGAGAPAAAQPAAPQDPPNPRDPRDPRGVATATPVASPGVEPAAAAASGPVVSVPVTDETPETDVLTRPAPAVVTGTVLPPPPPAEPRHRPTPLPAPLIGETIRPAPHTTATPHPQHQSQSQSQSRHQSRPHTGRTDERTRSQRFWDSVNTAGALQLLVMISLPLTLLVSVIWMGRSTT
jgi:hypothetical protein